MDYNFWLNPLFPKQAVALPLPVPLLGKGTRTRSWKYLHSLLPVVIVKFHVAASLDPTHDPGLLLGKRGHQDLRRGSEVRGPIAQHHAGGFVNAGGNGINGGFDFNH